MKRLFLLCGAIAIAACSDTTKTASVDADAGTSTTPLTYDFSAMDQYLFAGSWQTEGVVVHHRGSLVYEKYAQGYDANKRHINYSVSKSVGSALTGIAVADGLVKLDESVCTYITPPAGADPTLCDTKVEHVLQMRSGLKWREDYEEDPSASNVIPMLYGDEADMGMYVATVPREHKAGEHWSYSSGDSNLLARVVRGALKEKNMLAWAKEKLFVPAGLSSMFFESDRNGTLVFAAGAYMTVRDMARFGQLYVDGGKSGATQVLPADWVAYSQKPAPPVATPRPRDDSARGGSTGGSYGAAFWLNATSPTAAEDTLAFADGLPAETFFALGHWGQVVVIIPSKQLVIARVGNDRTPVFELGPMAKHALTAIEAAK